MIERAEAVAMIEKLFPYIMANDVDGLANEIFKLPVEAQAKMLNGCKQAVVFARAVVVRVEGLKKQQDKP
jgi:hypothetical protein